MAYFGWFGLEAIFLYGRLNPDISFTKSERVRQLTAFMCGFGQFCLGWVLIENLCRWLPPEVLSGESHGASTDVYAYGIVLWELLSWDIPWKEESPWQVNFRSVQTPRPNRWSKLSKRDSKSWRCIHCVAAFPALDK